MFNKAAFHRRDLYNLCLKYIGLIIILLKPVLAHSELSSIEDEDLSEISGQAFISVDKTLHHTYDNSSQTGLSYTRINYGADIEAFVTADTLELGRYDRWEPKRNANEKQPADILIENFAVGHIYSEKFYSENPTMKKPREGGYGEGDIVPFRIKDPYLEFAFKELNGVKQIVGMRMGFTEAEGLLSGNILSLTGNIDVKIEGNLPNLRDAMIASGTTGTTADIIKAFGWMLPHITLGTQAQLVYGPDEGALAGELDPVRASYSGVPNSYSMHVSDGMLINVDIDADQCQLEGLPGCFPLTDFASLHIGEKDDSGNPTGPAKGMFMSFQTEAMDWMTNVKGANSAANYMPTTSGAFMNIPSGGIKMDFVQSLSGIDRARTEYIDRGHGLF